MIKKIALASLLFCTTSIMAQELHHEESESEIYVVVKRLFTTGEKITEQEAGNKVVLDGKSGGGLGIDLGYTLPYHFALEIDTSYSTNKVKIDDELESAKYLTYAMDVVYTYPLTHALGVMGKVGYEFEHETLNEETVNDNDFVYGAGLEYHIVDNYEALVEYEGSLIDSARGSSIYVGLKYIF